MNTELVMKTSTGVEVKRILGEKTSNNRKAFLISNGDYHDVMIALTHDILSADIVAKQMAMRLKQLLSDCERWYVNQQFTDGTCSYNIVTNDKVDLGYLPSECGGSIINTCFHNNDDTDEALIAAAWEENDRQWQQVWDCEDFEL